MLKHLTTNLAFWDVWQLTVHDVLFEGDPMAGVKPIEADGKLVPAEKGIRRRGKHPHLVCFVPFN